MSNYNNRLGLRMFLRACALILLLTVMPVHAQLPTGTILGVVKDASGGVVPGVTVTVQNAETGFSRTVMTEDDGSYRVSALPVGRYTVRAEKSGFKTVTQRELTLDVAQELVVNPVLEVGTSAQEVIVTAEACRSPKIKTPHKSAHFEFIEGS